MLDMIHQMMEHGVQKGLLQQHTDPQPLDGASFLVGGKALRNFGSCSYLGLEFHPAIQQGIIDATRMYGSQFSSSRAYMSLGLYERLEALLGQIFERPVVAAASTTLGHLSALPVLVGKDDCVILDFLVHSSVQMTAQLLKAQGTTVRLIPHNNLEALSSKIERLRGKHRRIWYLADGVYSMHGDYAPLEGLTALLEQHRQLHLYVDDAHGMGWAGARGAGYVRSRIDHHPRMVMATSMNKAMAAAGGVIVLPDAELHRDVRRCGKTMIFSGPIQPPMLGAAIASAELMLSPELPRLQAALAERIAFTNDRLAELGIPQCAVTDSPLFFIPAGLPRCAATIIAKMLDGGFYLNSAGFPAVPMKKSGIRFGINLNHSIDEIDAMLCCLQRAYVSGLRDEGSSLQEVARTFRLPPIEIAPLPQLVSLPREEAPPLAVSVHQSISEIAPEEWDARFSGAGTLHRDTLRLLEAHAAAAEAPEERWELCYPVVRDGDGAVVLMGMYSCALMMDDMLAPAAVSAKLQELRADDPYYLTSPVVMSGSPLTKGDALWIDYDHPRWRDAVAALVEAMQESAEAAQASRILIREIGAGDRERLRDWLLELGMAEQRLPDSCVVPSLADRDTFIAGMSSRYRYDLRREVLRHEDRFVLRTDPPQTAEDRRACYALYEAVHDRSLELSVFKLPEPLLSEMCRDPQHEVLRLYTADDPSAPVAVMYCHRHGETYSALLVGFREPCVGEASVYKQILWRTVLRAQAVGARRLDLGWTAELQKRQIGAVRAPHYGYVTALEHYSFAVLEAIA